MLTSKTQRMFAVVSVIVMCILTRGAGAQDASSSSKSDATQEMLTPCLAVAADGSPIWPSTSFPSCKQLTAAFRLPSDDASKSLSSRWVAAGDDKPIAENTLDLKGQKTGWLRLQLKQPAPPGKYRLETMLDGKPWKSVDLEITPAITKGKAEKSSDLIPLTEDKAMRYDLSVRSAPGTTVEIPGVKPDADGVSRASLVMNAGKKEDAGTHYTVSINDKPVGEMWVKLDDGGMQAYRKKEGDETKDLNPPVMIQPLPPKMDDGTEWTSKTEGGEQQALTLFGPVPIDGPDGPTPGYLVFADRAVTMGNPGTEAAHGRETTERYYIPKLGLVREVHVNTMDGKLTSRHEIALPTSRAYKMVANPNMKGRLGRVQFTYPPDTKISESRVSVFKAGAKPNDKPVSTGYGEQAYELMPGKYEIAINNKRIPVEVKSGHDTVPTCGVLRIHAGSETRFKVLDADKKTELHSGYGEQDVALPVGNYVLEIAGAAENVKIEDGKVTEF